MGHRTSPELEELREAWKWAVCLGRPLEPGLRKERPFPCWFGENVPGIDTCEHGPRWIECAHWIKRQRVERWIAYQVFGVGKAYLTREQLELVSLAAWDPRNGVPACEKHHRRFDGHRVDARNELVIWRHEVPAHVEAFALDWGLEQALEDRHPPIGKGV